MLLAFGDVGAATLDDKFAEKFVAEQDLAGLDLIGGEQFDVNLTADDADELLFQLSEVGGKVVNTNACSEGVGFLAREQFDQMLKICKSIINRRGCEMIDLLPFAEVVKSPVTRAARLTA